MVDSYADYTKENYAKELKLHQITLKNPNNLMYIKMDAEYFREGLPSVVQHQFGEHSKYSS